MLTVFDKAEYGRRLAKVRASMKAKNIDVLIEPDPANMNYLTGYDGWSFYVPQMILVPVEESAEPVWVGRGVDIGGARLTCWMSKDNIVAYPEDTVQHPTRHPMQFVAKVLQDRGWANRRIGVWLDNYYYTPRADDALRNALPNAQFVPADLLVNWVRLIKSDLEIKKIREAARVTEKIVDTYYRVMRPGVRQCDAAAEIVKSSINGTSQYGGDYASCMPFIPIGEQTQASHLTWTDQKIKKGQTTYIECAGVRHRYHSPLARSIHLGKPPKNLVDCNEAVLEGMAAALDQARPGKTPHDMAMAWQKVLDRYGLTKESRIGYPIGIGYPPDWGEHTASLRKDDRTELKPNMCFHMILGMWMDGWGFESSETFRITNGAAECFANVPRGLKVIDGSSPKGTRVATSNRSKAPAKKAKSKKPVKKAAKRRR